LICKIKDMRGVNVTAVKIAIFKEFSLQSISSNYRQKAIKI
ncbi:11409_t:CDS:1, partial [Funneliformis caledonium]